jgi:hypothetical protein
VQFCQAFTLILRIQLYGLLQDETGELSQRVKQLAQALHQELMAPPDLPAPDRPAPDIPDPDAESNAPSREILNLWVAFLDPRYTSRLGEALAIGNHPINYHCYDLV